MFIFVRTACLQSPPSKEKEAIFVNWCKLVGAKIGASTRHQVKVRRRSKFGELAAIWGAWWEVVGHWVLQVLLNEVYICKLKISLHFFLNPEYHTSKV